MFITKDYLNMKDGFDWSRYFNENKESDFTSKLDIKEIYQNVRMYLKEDNIKMGFVIHQILKKLLNSENISSPAVLELGAATGFLTRSILGLYNGMGVLVDKNRESNNQFNKLKDQKKLNIEYIINDIFELDIKERFDIVCSFGLIEHFPNKKEVILIHSKFVKPNGKVLIIVPLDTPLSRAYFEVNPELNLGYRELLSKKEFIQELEQCNLKTVRTMTSFSYTYDFIAALCILK